MHRKTLKKYYGKIVQVKCNYCKYDKNKKVNNTNLKYKYEPEIIILDDVLHSVYKQKNTCIHSIAFKSDAESMIKYNAFINPIMYVKKTSPIYNVIGINGFSDICEDHAIVQGYLYEFLNKHQKVFWDSGGTLELEFYAKVYKYKYKNSGKTNYGLLPLSQINAKEICI